MADKDFYEILGVNKNASDDEIKKSYRKLAMKYHPDRTGNDKGAEKKFKEIKEGSAIYYIASIPFRHKEQFTIQVRAVNSEGLNSLVKFTQQFYVD